MAWPASRLLSYCLNWTSRNSAWCEGVRVRVRVRVGVDPKRPVSEAGGEGVRVGVRVRASVIFRLHRAGTVTGGVGVGVSDI